jgi:hypothetical protein
MAFSSSPSLQAEDSQHRAALAVNVRVRRPGYFCPASALWIAELGDSGAQRNRRTIWGAMNAPGEDAAISRDSFPLASRTARIVERV